LKILKTKQTRLKTKSAIPEVALYQDVILKIGFAGGDLKIRISNTRNEATYLLSNLGGVAEFEL
jgi:hypothetical protein